TRWLPRSGPRPNGAPTTWCATTGSVRARSPASRYRNPLLRQGHQLLLRHPAAATRQQLAARAPAPAPPTATAASAPAQTGVPAAGQPAEPQGPATFTPAPAATAFDHGVRQRHPPSLCLR